MSRGRIELHTYDFSVPAPRGVSAEEHTGKGWKKEAV